MLAKVHRVQTPDQFKRVFAEGQKSHHAAFMVIAARNTTGVPRFGFIVSKKVGNSVVRHAVVRQLRETVRELVPQLDGVDVVVVGKAPLATSVPHDAVLHHIKTAIRRLR